MKTKTKVSSSGKPKHPANVYILFTNVFNKRHPGIKKATNISKAAAREWHRLDDIGRAPYFAEYKRLMEVYIQSKNINNNCGDGGYERKTKVCSRNKSKRPPSAFFLFVRKFKQMHPELKTVGEIAKAAGEEWRALSDAEKDPYIKEYNKQMKDYMQCKKRSVMAPQLDDTPPQVYATAGQISRRTGSAEFLQQSNEVARESAKNASGFAYGKDKEVVPSRSDSNRVDHATATDSVALREQILELERKLGLQHQSDSEVADLNQRIEELLVKNEELERKLGQQQKSHSEVANLKETIEELLVKNEELERKLGQQHESHSEVANLKQTIEELLVKNEELERKLGQLHESHSEVANLKKTIEELLVKNEELERKLGQLHESHSEVAHLKQTIEELLVQNEDLQLKLKESMLQNLSHLEEEFLDFDKKLHEEVPLPCAREEVMSENAQHHRILRSSDSANKRVLSSLFATPPDADNEMKTKGEDSHPATAGRRNAGRKSSLQVSKLRPSKTAAASWMVTAASAAHPAAGSRVSKQRQQLQPAASAAHSAAGSQVSKQWQKLQPAASAAHSAAGSRVSKQRQQLQPAASRGWVW